MVAKIKNRLKGQCHEIFCFRFFQESHSPKPLIITIGSFRIFSKIRRDIRKSRCTTGVNDTGDKFATGINDTGGKFCHQFSLCCWHRWQIIGTISGCRHLKVNLRQKFIYMCPLLPKGDQIKLLKFFWLRIFPFATGVVDTGGKPWAANISAKFQKNLKQSEWNTVLWGWG